MGGVRNTLTGNIMLTKNRKQISITLNNGNRVRQSISKMVATAFIPNPENLKYTMPINENKYDARAENIKWVKQEIPQDHNDSIKIPQTYKGLLFESKRALRRYKEEEHKKKALKRIGEINYKYNMKEVKAMVKDTHDVVRAKMRSDRYLVRMLKEKTKKGGANG